MFTKRIIPCLDVNKGRVVKGVNFVDLKDAGDPVEIAKAYDAAGADELVFLDITASCEERDTVVDMVRAVAANVGCNSSYHIHHGITLLAGGSDIKKNKLVRTGCIVSFGNFHRISGILKINKIHAFYYTSFIYIQTWNDSFCKHDYASFPVPDSSAAKFSRIFKPHRLLFSGWN